MQDIEFKESIENIERDYDPNHCATVPWSRDDDEGFRREWIVAIRRSIDMSS